MNIPHPFTTAPSAEPSTEVPWWVIALGMVGGVYALRVGLPSSEPTKVKYSDEDFVKDQRQRADEEARAAAMEARNVGREARMRQPVTSADRAAMESTIRDLLARRNGRG